MGNQFQWRRIGAVLAGGALLCFGAPASAVPIVIDLVTGNTGTSNNAIYNWTDQQSTGTGVIDPFLRVQGSPTEQGYNSDAGTPWDTKGGKWTHDLQVSDLTTVAIGLTNYYEFLLDINENNSDKPSLLSLNSVKIFTRAGAIGSAPESLAGLGALRFDMDVGAQGDTTVELDYDRNPGSGAGDMFMYVPTSLFAGALTSDYVYFYTNFGTPDNSEAGFEEWAVIKRPKVPEPGTLTLLGLGLSGLALRRRKIFR